MKIKKGVIIQRMGDVFVAYDNDTSTLHELNETAYLILLAIEKRKSKQQIINKLIKEFKVGKNKAVADYDDFLKILKNKDLVVNKK